MNKKCPWCDSDNNHQFLKLKDYFLTQEDFEILECNDCKLLFTTPCPAPDKIGDYYKSDNYLSHNENNKGLFSYIYNKVKKINIRNKFKIIGDVKSAMGNVPKLLDIGCGVGDFLLFAKEKGWEINGVEPSVFARTMAEKKLNTKILSLNELKNIPDNSFDVVTMWHVLEHVDDLRTEMFHLQRIIKNDGKLILALPNYKSYDAEHYKDKWAAYDVPRHLNHFTKTSLNNIIKETRFQLIDIKPLRWDSYYISILSEHYLNNKRAFLNGVLNGCKSNIKARQTGEWSSLVYVLTKDRLFVS